MTAFRRGKVNHRVAGLHSDTDVERHDAGGLATHPSTGGIRGAYRARGIVLMRGRCSKKGVDLVADVFLDGAALVLDEDAKLVEGRAERALESLRAETQRVLCRPDDIDKEAGDQSALFATIHLSPGAGQRHSRASRLTRDALRARSEPISSRAGFSVFLIAIATCRETAHQVGEIHAKK